MSLRALGISEAGYTELRTYEHGNPSWRPYPPKVTLLDRGYLKSDGHGFYSITDAGRKALASVRKHYGLPEGV